MSTKVFNLFVGVPARLFDAIVLMSTCPATELIIARGWETKSKKHHAIHVNHGLQFLREGLQLYHKGLVLLLRLTHRTC